MEISQKIRRGNFPRRTVVDDELSEQHLFPTVYPDDTVIGKLVFFLPAFDCGRRFIAAQSVGGDPDHPLNQAGEVFVEIEHPLFDGSYSRYRFTLLSPFSVGTVFREGKSVLYRRLLPFDVSCSNFVVLFSVKFPDMSDSMIPVSAFSTQ